MTSHRPTTRRPVWLAIRLCLALAFLLSLSAASLVLGQDQTPPADAAPTDNNPTADPPAPADPDAATDPAKDPNADPAIDPSADPTNDPAIEPQPQPEPTLTVRELVVLQTDRYGEIANDKTTVTNSLFNGVPHRGRLRAPGDLDTVAKTTMPVGFITFEGEIKTPLRVYTDLVDESGFFHAHWPEDALKGPRSIDWREVQQASDELRVIPQEISDHWLHGLRESDDRLWLRTRNPALRERFLLYDASLPFKPALKLEQVGDSMQLASKGDAAGPPFAMVLSETAKGWSAATTLGPWADQAGVPIDLQGPESIQASTDKAALKPLAHFLEGRGYNEQEIKTAIAIVRGAKPDRSSMSLIYILPQDTIQAHIRLLFKPQPDRVIRTAIVVVNNVDPDLGSRLDQLVEGLGSDSWAVRENSQRELEAIGLAAIRKVQSARENADPEVAFRVRQILDAYDLRQRAAE